MQSLFDENIMVPPPEKVIIFPALLNDGRSSISGLLVSLEVFPPDTAAVYFSDFSIFPSAFKPESSYIKYVEFQGAPKIFSAKPLDGNIYCLDITSGNSYCITGSGSFSPAATADQRLVLTANSGSGPVIRLIDSKSASFAGDIILTERSGANDIPLLENIRCIAVY